MPIEPPPTRWRFPPVDVADEHGIVGVGRRSRAGHPARGLPRGDCSRCPRRHDGPMGWWSPDPRGVLPLDGAPREPLAATLARSASSSASTRPSRRWWRLRRPAHGRAAGSPMTSARPTSALHELGGRTASRRGMTTAWRAGCTAWPSAGCSPASRCSTDAPTHRRWRCSASSSCSPSTPTLAGARRAVGHRAPGHPRRRGGRPDDLPRAVGGGTGRAAARPLALNP